MKTLIHTCFPLLFIIASVFSQNVYRPPEWAKTAVWYQIFPERFRNGDVKNDPTINDLKGSWPHDQVTEWQVSSWTNDWYDLQPWEKNNGKGFYYNSQLRRYGGDLQGVIDKLDYLTSLGISALYLNPIFESPSLHKYDATYYHHVDNNFGPDPSRDKEIWLSETPSDPSTWKWTTADSLFLKLITECHARNIKIIIDGVFNHTGMTFWAFEDVKKYGEQSYFKDWFTIKKFDDPSTPKNEFDYEGWYGVKELPEIKEDFNGFSPSITDHIQAVVKRWMDPNADGNPSDGIDGWRLDVANMVNINFWKKFRSWTREINPESYVVGEVWWEDWSSNKMFDPAPWISNGDVFDAVMNYRAMMPIYDYCANKTKKISSSQFMDRYINLQKEFAPDITQVQMNTLDSHDTDRLPSIIVNPDRDFDHIASAKDNPNYNVRKPNAQEISLQKMILTLQFVSTGAPSIYYGNETGMWGGDDPDERKPMVWADMKFMPEKSHPFGKVRPVDSVAFDTDLFEFHQKLIQVRHSHTSLSLGVPFPLLVSDGKNAVAFSKISGNDSVIVIVNNASVTQTISVKSLWNKKLHVYDLLSGKETRVRKNIISLQVPPKRVVVLGSRKK